MLFLCLHSLSVCFQTTKILHNWQIAKIERKKKCIRATYVLMEFCESAFGENESPIQKNEWLIQKNESAKEFFESAIRFEGIEQCSYGLKTRVLPRSVLSIVSENRKTLLRR